MDETHDVLRLLEPRLIDRTPVRLLLSFVALCVILSSLSAQLAAFDSLGFAAEPTFEERFARSGVKPVPAARSAQQRDNEVQLLDFLARRKSAYAQDADELIDLAGGTAVERQSAGLQPITAVVLSWKRRRGLGIVLKHLATTPFIREVIVWNNNVEVYLEHEDLEADMTDGQARVLPRLRVINAPSNLHDMVKHYACAMATFEHCYFNDDDWLNPRIDSSYAKYLDDGAHRIVTNTMPYIAWESRRWRFSNSAIDLHSGFTWLGTGAFFPRHFSARFLDQLSTSHARLDPASALTADMHFSLLQNSFPEQMPNSLMPIDVEGEDASWKLSVKDQWAVFFPSILHAVRVLHDVLSLKDPYLSPEPFPISPPQPEHEARAPCADDDCLFITNLSPFPSPDRLVHRQSVAAQHRSFLARLGLSRSSASTSSRQSGFNPHAIDHISEYEARFDALVDADGSKLFPPVQWFLTNGSWHLAVDNDPDTCWDSWHKPQLDDYFGLMLVPARPIRSITVTGSSELAGIVSDDYTDAALSQGWEIWTLAAEPGADWRRRRVEGQPRAIDLDQGRVEIIVELKGSADESIKKFRFVSHDDKTRPVRVCEITVA